MKIISYLLTIVTILNEKVTYGISLDDNEQKQQKQPNPSPSNNNKMLTPTLLFLHNNKDDMQNILNVEDTKCNVEQVEEANDSQLHVITKELKRTMFFKTFAVDLDHGCPLTGWKKKQRLKKIEEDKKNKNDGVSKSGEDDDDEKEGECSCGIDSATGNNNDDDDDASLPPWMKQDDSKSSKNPFDIPPERKSKLVEEDDDNETEEEEESQTNNNDYDDDFDEETFECGGGVGDDDEEEELDTDEPLCHVEGESLTTIATKSLSPVKELFSSALKKLSEKFTWDSESQRNTFSWFQHSDPVVIKDGDGDSNSGTSSSSSISTSSKEIGKDDLCDDDIDAVPDTFWMDMCSEIKAGDGLQIVNLELNLERNTGYNGTHIWRTIYEENCVMMDEHTNNMCYEERVLYRLLSGLHTSTTLSIATNYYPPSKRKNRIHWESNPTYFYNKFEHHPEYIRNLHFSYLVMLRALKKAKGFLYNYEIRTGDIVEDEKATVLLRRLLDTHILTSCSDVFDAFDENLMFNSSLFNYTATTTTTSKIKEFPKITTTTSPTKSNLRYNFKGIFHNISSILDCVQCQQCKLHGKMAMLGYGTALKILFTSNPNMISKKTISRNEVVAFINTICKFSDSLKEVRMLTNLYWVGKSSTSATTAATSSSSATSNSVTDATLSSRSASKTQGQGQGQGQQQLLPATDHNTLSDKAVSIIVELSKQKLISMEEEVYLVQLALSKKDNNDLLLLVKYYHNDVQRLLIHIKNSILNKNINNSIKKEQYFHEPDAIIIGSGLAGLVTAVQILDRGGRVTLIDKEHTMGGNSAKASSGINGCCLPNDEEFKDSIETFKSDTIKSAGTSAQLDMIDTLVKNSGRALKYLSDRIGIDLSLVAQLGGHSKKRTHRPNNGMVGAEVIYGMTKVVKEFEKKGYVKLLLDCKVIQLLTSDNDDGSINGVIGVKYLNLKTNETYDITSPRVILATGGFAHARSTSSKSSLLTQYRPEYVNIPATAGHFSTGDGINLATTIQTSTSKLLNANTIDMNHIQIHPTGWIDPNEPASHSKILAAELLRGVGGILLTPDGKRFCNEVGTRAYVSEQMLIQSNTKFNVTKQWDKDYDLSSFYLLLSEDAGVNAKKHVDLYTYKGLMKKIVGLKALADYMNSSGGNIEYDNNMVTIDAIRNTLISYSNDAKNGHDAFGKTTFNNIPKLSSSTNEEDDDNIIFYIGKVTPVLHYCMGGLSITTNGEVLNTSNSIIPGLHAVGEVSGGVHGINRLAGNSLLECTVFGMIVGESIPIKSLSTTLETAKAKEVEETTTTTTTSLPKTLSIDELSKHNKQNDCWVSINSKIYNLTEFALEHPPGPESIYEVGGVDATDAFLTVHNIGLLDDFDDVLVGALS